MSSCHSSSAQPLSDSDATNVVVIPVTEIEDPTATTTTTTDAVAAAASDGDDTADHGISNQVANGDEAEMSKDTATDALAEVNSKEPGEASNCTSASKTAVSWISTSIGENVDGSRTAVAPAKSDWSHIGWSVKADHIFPRPGRPLFLPRFRQTLPLLGQIPKFAKFWVAKRLANQRVPMDHANLVPYRPIYGAPIGGIGSGTIGRAFGGAFCRFHMVPGHYCYRVVDADQFILRVARPGSSTAPVWQQALCVAGDATRKSKALPQWTRLERRDLVSYRAVYPQSWTTYSLASECGVEAVCHQLTPVIAGDYTESCFPGAVFVWDVKNVSGQQLDISMAFSFKNGTGEARFDRRGGCYTEASMVATEDGRQQVRCARICQELHGMATTYCLGVLGGDGDEVKTSHKLTFDPLGSGADLWQELQSRGCFSSMLDERSKTTTARGQEVGTAVAASCWRVPPGAARQLVFCLVWHQPSIHFNSRGQVYSRRYRRFWPDADALVSHAMSSYRQWQKAIEAWQQPVLADESLPEWLRSGLFNELYYVADGGTVWVDIERKQIESEAISAAHRQLLTDYGKFAYLEGHEYRMYTTYDVHFNASFALVQLWPALQLTVQYDIARTTPMADTRPSIFLMGETGVVKVAGCVPHDLGDPDNEPWQHINAYFVHPTDQWKDLNLKFILQTWRDFVFTKRRCVIEDMYSICSALASRCLAAWDHDGDGLIENGGAADQTYDNWVMTGPSAYCGGLWLAAVRACELMARELDKADDVKFFSDLLRRATDAYEKRLWNGSYYNFDCSRRASVRSSVMADQLAGYWYLRMCDLVFDSSVIRRALPGEGERASDGLMPREHVASVLEQVVKNNFRAVAGGLWGVVNGAKPDGRGVDKSYIQSEEVWVGVNYCLASLLIANDRRADGLAVAQAVNRSIYDSMGLGFQTPEAYNLQFKFRSLGYMRPLAIWAMVPALRVTQVASQVAADAEKTTN